MYTNKEMVGGTEIKKPVTDVDLVQALPAKGRLTTLKFVVLFYRSIY